jgi:hypothetical protein
LPDLDGRKTSEKFAVAHVITETIAVSGDIVENIDQEMEREKKKVQKGTCRSVLFKKHGYEYARGEIK